MKRRWERYEALYIEYKTGKTQQASQLPWSLTRQWCTISARAAPVSQRQVLWAHSGLLPTDHSIGRRCAESWRALGSKVRRAVVIDEDLRGIGAPDLVLHEGSGVTQVGVCREV